jgi:hypothetical protein
MRRTPIASIVLVSSISVLNSANLARAASYPVCLAGGSNNALRCNYANFEKRPHQRVWWFGLLR